MKKEWKSCAYCGLYYQWDDEAPQWGHTDVECIARLDEEEERFAARLKEVMERRARLNADIRRRAMKQAAEEGNP